MGSTARMLVQGFSFQCHLGCLPSERELRQEVRLSLDIRFPSLPRACESDQLEDTVCYAKLCQSVKGLTEGKSYSTVEHLALEIHKELRKAIPEGCTWSLDIHKVHPPVEGLRGGVHFRLEEDL